MPSSPAKASPPEALPDLLLGEVADDLGGHPADDRELGHVPGDDGARGHDRAVADPHPGEHRDVGTDPDPLPDADGGGDDVAAPGHRQLVVEGGFNLNS